MAKAKTKNLDAFRNQFDKNVVVPNKIRAAFAKMIADNGDEAWEYEADFLKLAGVSTTDFGAFREQFSKHVVEAREQGRGSKRIWFANAKVAERAFSK